MALAPPTNLTATVVNGSVVLKWTNGDVYYSAIWYKSADGGKTWTHSSTPGNTVTDRAVTAGGTYQYYVMGYSQALGGSAPTPKVTVTIYPPVVVAPPAIAGTALRLSSGIIGGNPAGDQTVSFSAKSGSFDALGDYLPPPDGSSDVVTATSNQDATASASVTISGGYATAVYVPPTPPAPPAPPPVTPPNPPPVPQPAPPSMPTVPVGCPVLSQHPRLLMTAKDLARYQSWAVQSNPVYVQGFLPALAISVKAYQVFFPGGTGALTDVAANPFPDKFDRQGYNTLPGNWGGVSVSGNVEEHAIYFAFMAMIDPIVTDRPMYAGMARNLVMMAMNAIANGTADPLFAIYNRANATGDYWASIIDWLQYANALSAADKAICVKAGLVLCNTLMGTDVWAGAPPANLLDSVKLLPGGDVYWTENNNYDLGHLQMMVGLATCLDDADDPGLQLRGFLHNATGHRLFRLNANMQDKATVEADYGVTIPNAGWASGGLPPEGSLYGESYGFIFGTLLNLTTAGCDDPTVFGPQVKLTKAPFQDRFVVGYLSQYNPAQVTEVSWQGPIFEIPGYGDMLRAFITANDTRAYCCLALLQQQHGRTENLNALRWALVNGPEGGAANFLHRIASSSYGAMNTIMAYLVMDPNLPAPTDPRPNFPTYFLDAGLCRVMSRTSWDVNASIYAYAAPPLRIGHEQCDAGCVSMYRKGEWLTKQLCAYDNNGMGQLSFVHNTFSAQNVAQTPPTSANFQHYAYEQGSQFWLNMSAGDPKSFVSHADAYDYAWSDLTPLYNLPNQFHPDQAALAVSQVVVQTLRITAWDLVVRYATISSQAGLFKRAHLNSANQPVINGRTAVSTSRSGKQNLALQCLLPANATVTTAEWASKMNPLASEEPMAWVTTMEDVTSQETVNFLYVFQGTDAGVVALTAFLVDQTTVQIGNIVVAFGVVPAGLPAGMVVYQCGTAGVTKAMQ